MAQARRWQRSARRVFVFYAALSLVPVLVLGATLLWLTARQANDLSLRLASQEVAQVTDGTLEPLLDGHDLSIGLQSVERGKLQSTVLADVASQQILRLRLRDLKGNVVYSDDGSGLDAGTDPEVMQAAMGKTVVHITHLNNDPEDTGPVGPVAIEAYAPVHAVGTMRPIGVVELYLPFAPIAADKADHREELELAIGSGLVLLWLVLLWVSRSVSSRLNRQTTLAVRNMRHDQLTGLLNRATFIETISGRVKAAEPFSVGYLDIQEMREVNQTLGYEVGDELIAAIAARIEEALPAGSPPARLGGDKFGFVFTGGLPQLEELRRACILPLRLAWIPFAVHVRMGWAEWSPDETIGALLVKADIALAEARRTRTLILQWAESIDRHDPDALHLLGELSEAIATEQFELHFQPKVSAMGGEMVGVEALIRWRHPTRGLLFPDAFLEAAERTELIDELTRWIIPAACVALRALPPMTSMAINVSAASLIRDDFAAEVLSALAASGTPTDRIVLEITETALIADPQLAAQTLGILAVAGVRISIDDFGAGQTSLGHLAGLPISELKVDRSFVMQMSGDAKNTAIVSSVIEMGHALGLTVVAEGVEDAETRDALQSLGCDLMQGYHFARPQPLAALLGSLSAKAEQPAPIV